MDATMTSRRTRRAGLAIAATLALLLAGLIGLAAPAQAAVAIAVSASSGTVGVTQNVSASVSSSAIGAPSGTIAFTADGQPIGSVQVGGSLGSSADISWTPVDSGSIAVQATFTSDTGDTASDSRTVQIARVNTASTISTPGTAAASSVVVISATVRASKGQYIPTGTVTFLLNNGSVIGQSNLDGSGRASINYTTPANTGTVYMYASYGGDSNANTSKTSTDSIKVSAQASSVSLVVPQTNYVNTSVQLTARITPTSATGTVDFSVNGKYLGTGKVANGVANLTWVPNALGTFTLTAKYSGGNGVNAGSASNAVQVIEQLKADQITVDPAGSAAPWVPGGTVTMANGTSETLNVTAASGQTVRLSISGPCALSGNQVVVKGVGGACTLVASTNGGNGFAATTQKYYVQTVAGTQTAKIAAPPSGSYKKGQSLTLMKIGTKTNLGQPITWKVTSGSSYCSITKTSSNIKLKLKKKGTCKVKASAPAISNQWKAYSTTRSYKIT